MALANKEADINRCPPGGEAGIHELAKLLCVPFKPFDEGVVLKPLSVAYIDENVCIGCTLCLQACPVDAISGASKQMHTIIAQHCTGCELCIAPCPVDCISMLPVKFVDRNATSNTPIVQYFRFTKTGVPTPDQKRSVAKASRKRYQFHLERIERDKRERAEKLALKEQVAAKADIKPATDAQALIQAALERAKRQTAAAKPQNTEHLAPAQQAQIAEIEARRAKFREQEGESSAKESK
jgi:electron transport complex protein RnfB